MVLNSLLKTVFGDFSTQISTNPINLDKFLHEISIERISKITFTEIQMIETENSQENKF